MRQIPATEAHAVDPVTEAPLCHELWRADFADGEGSRAPSYSVRLGEGSEDPMKSKILQGWIAGLVPPNS